MVINTGMLLSYMVLIIMISQLLFTSSDALFGNSYLVNKVSAADVVAEAKEKSPVVCKGDFYFRAWGLICGTSALEINLPPPDIICDVIEGSLDLQAYSSQFAQYIPNSIKSLKVITGTLKLSYMSKFPDFLSSVTQVGYLQPWLFCSFDNPWVFPQITKIDKLEYHSQESVQAAFPNLTNLGSLTISDSMPTLLDIPKVIELQSLTIKSIQINKSLSSLSRVKRINGDLVVTESAFPNFALDSLTTVTGNVIFALYFDSPSRFSFPNGINIGGDLLIRSCSEDTTFDSLNGPVIINGSLSMYYNSGTVDISGLGPISVQNSIIIKENWGTIKKIDVSKITKLTGRVWIDNFGADDEYPMFSSLQSIGGDFRLPRMMKSNAASIPFYPKLKEVNGELEVRQANSLMNLNFLRSLDHIGSIFVVNNKNILSLEGIDKFPKMKSVKVVYNPKLKSLAGLRNLVHVDEEVLIAGNNKLSTLDGLNSLKYVGSLTISGNGNLRRFDGLNNLETIGGDLILKDNKYLFSIAALSKLNAVKSINMDMSNQQVMRNITFGKTGSNLGYPPLQLANLNKAKYLDLDMIKESFAPICKVINISDLQSFECNK